LKTAKADGMDVKERQKLRNQVSAQQSRIKKKEEVIHLHNVIRNKNEKLMDLIDILKDKLRHNPDIMINIANEMRYKFS
jgi:hypothetical protein